MITSVITIVSGASDGYVDDLYSTPCRTRVGFDIQPAVDRLSDVRQSFLTSVTLTRTPGQLGTFGNHIAVVAGIHQDTHRHASRW